MKIRLAGPALAAAVMLLAAGCGSSDDSSDDAATEETGASEQEGDDGAGADEDGADDAAGGETGAIAGIWGSVSGQDTLLQIGDDGLATLLTADDACLGGAQSMGDHSMISLQCSVATGYSSGEATLNGEALTVGWESGETVYERIADQAVDLAELNLGELGLEELEGIDLDNIDFEGFDIDELESLLPGSIAGPGDDD
ncbi:hypothetical protein [Streptomyces bohaiensis]|uniref:Secreted protein n=1 Tax=Streptomyces bohaiensis TaxID=1431344 RepID=A0ABX1C439_9ACTN|nr:hypothetical protein [Streptomyces bohaiensis]NJQ13986.1 hypothetical protein [Streptomyces bohaiensis]